MSTMKMPSITRLVTKSQFAADVDDGRKETS